MNEQRDSKWTKLRGDGGNQPLDAERFQELKDEFDQLCKDAGVTVNDRRDWAERTRFCVWDNQHPDGRKHKGPNGDDPFPFPGASDARIRLADDIGQEQVIIILAALMRARQAFKPAEGSDTETSALVGQLWEWCLANQLGAEWFVEWTKFVQWRQNDSPGLALMQVYWRQEYELRPRTITPADVVRRTIEQLTAMQVAMDDADVADLQDLVANTARRDELAELLLGLWPDMREDRAPKVAAALLEEGEATFPYPHMAENRLAVKARRPFLDVFLPENTPNDEQRARAIFIEESFTKAELEEMDARGVFKAGALDEILKHEGRRAWVEYTCFDGVKELDSPVERPAGKDRYRGLYFLTTAFFRATSADGIPGTYTVQYHHLAEKPATDAVLLDYRIRGKRYPFRAGQREILNNTLWQTRGIAELSASEQSAMKALHDMFMDNASLGGVPPIQVPISRPRLGLTIEPLAKIKVNRADEISWFPPPPFPAAADAAQQKIQQRVAEYFGRMHKDVSPDKVRLYQQWLVDFIMIDAKEVLRMGIQLIEQYLPDEVILRALGPTGQRLIDLRNSGDRSESQWVADVEVSFEAGMLNFEFLKAIGDMMTQYVLSWDTLSIVQRDKLVRWFMSAISPSLAAELTVPVETASTREVEDELAAFATIAAGAEPPMKEGVNYELRLQTLLDVPRKNPEAWARLAPTSRRILAARISYYQNQIQQKQNALIGATMQQPALGPEEQAQAELATSGEAPPAA